MDSIEWLFSLFVWHPVRIAGVSCFFLVGFFGMRLLNHKYPLFRNRLLLISGVMWALFSLYEWHCKSQRYNIRVDLFFIYPVLMSVSIGSVLVAVANLLLSLRKNKELEMENIRKTRKCCISVIRLATKILATLLVVSMMVMFIGQSLIGEGPGNPFKHPLPVQLGFVGMVAIWVGMIIGWKWERIAGLLVISGMAIFHILEGKLWLNWTFGLFDLVGILFLVCWWLKKLQAGRVKLKK